jgi:hypothetical protein
MGLEDIGNFWLIIHGVVVSCIGMLMNDVPSQAYLLWNTESEVVSVAITVSKYLNKCPWVGFP